MDNQILRRSGYQRKRTNLFIGNEGHWKKEHWRI